MIENNTPKDFKFKKKFGQNFLKDTNLLKAIVADAKVQQDDCVLEIGAGAGALTEQICVACPKGKVVSVEIDNTLKDFLQEKFKNQDNLQFVFGDILKIPTNEIEKLFNGKPFRVVANLPYYISSPIIFYLIESGLNIKSITVMLQKELVDRITAKPNNKDYGAISVILGLYGKVKKTRDVPRQLFTPMPNVDSGILSIEIEPTQLPISKISKVVKGCFAMRRKTLANNLIHSFNISTERAESVLEELNLDKNIRAENLNQEQYILLTKKLGEFL